MPGPAAECDGHDHVGIIYVHILVNSQPHVVENLHLIGDEPHRSVMPAPFALGEGLTGLQHNVCVKRHLDVFSPGTHVPAPIGLVDGGHPALDDLDVLMRHAAQYPAETIVSSAGVGRLDVGPSKAVPIPSEPNRPASRNDRAMKVKSGWSVFAAW